MPTRRSSLAGLAGRPNLTPRWAITARLYIQCLRHRPFQAAVFLLRFCFQRTCPTLEVRGRMSQGREGLRLPGHGCAVNVYKIAVHAGRLQPSRPFQRLLPG